MASLADWDVSRVLLPVAECLGSRPKVALSQQPGFPGRPSGGGNFWAVPSGDQKGLAYSIAFGVGRERLIAISRAVARP